ncbi:RND family efflux transporter, MFP subunit [Desulfosporosinus acidiphilus SJ4]|uniref:RND family efflux transporter, MFP subunit n=1 Tax=Desulfosporosinus acidiphilus (strain DSM 22704 / JCM 16185 / SJ4) TaxID=646529 RepID=I4DBB7_DESAJ|nr:efflux RND transporter periplasmic adaptor subunit [Desulfosporosinus acidiphilus]AFM43091.1 RND family efflux transporter, MFP subunit [Desulfosporosinus acidiphilus SJ4]
MKKRLGWGIGIGLVLAAGLGWWFWRNSQSPLKVSSGMVSRISMQEDIYATGSVVPNSRQDVYALNSGIVSKVAVQAGDSVKAGQALVAFNSTLADAQVAQAQANVEAAQASVNAAQRGLEDIKQAQSAAKASAVTAGGVQAGSGTVNISGTGGGNLIPNNGAGSNGAVTNPATHSLAAANTALSSSLESTQAVHQAEGTLAQSQAGLKQAQEALNVAQVQRDQFTSKAAADGTVLEVNVQAGEPAPVQQPLVVVADLAHLNVLVQLNEMDATKVKVGGKVKVTSKTLGSASLTGVIEKIAPEAVAQPTAAQGSASPTVAVTIRLDKVPAELKPGYSVTIQAIVATKKGVLAVPLEALFQEGSKNYVYRIQDGHLHKTEVKVGIGNDTDQEITSGLKPGDLIVLNPTNELSEGLAVTPDQGSGSG